MKIEEYEYFLLKNIGIKKSKKKFKTPTEKPGNEFFQHLLMKDALKASGQNFSYKSVTLSPPPPPACFPANAEKQMASGGGGLRW